VLHQSKQLIFAMRGEKISEPEFEKDSCNKFSNDVFLNKMLYLKHFVHDAASK
jgi:hypothetical protein